MDILRVLISCGIMPGIRGCAIFSPHPHLLGLTNVHAAYFHVKAHIWSGLYCFVMQLNRRAEYNVNPDLDTDPHALVDADANCALCIARTCNQSLVQNIVRSSGHHRICMCKTFCCCKFPCARKTVGNAPLIFAAMI